MKDEIPEGYVRVTQVLKAYTPFPVLDPDSRFAQNVKAAAERGKRVHELCEAYALGLFVEDCDPSCKGYLQSFKKWFYEAVDSVVATEHRINNADYKLSGAVDMVCKIKGDCALSLIDFKTPPSPSKTWQLQTAAYRILLRENGLATIRRLCVLLDREGGDPTVIEYSDHERDEELFLGALKLHYFFK